MEKHLLLSSSLLLWCLCLLNGVVETSSPNCSGAFFSLSDCLDFVLEGSRVYPRRGGACCNELGSVVKQSSNTCLCEAAVEATRLGIHVNVTRALVLLSVCKLVSAPVGPCDIASPIPTTPSSETMETPSPAPNFMPENAPVFPPDQSLAPSFFIKPRPVAPPPFVPKLLSPQSGSYVVQAGRRRSAIYFNLIITSCLILASL